MSKLVTPIFRAAYVGLFTPTGMKDDPKAKKKYSIRAIFEPGTDLTELKKAIDVALVERFGNSIPKNAKKPFRLNGDLDNPIPGVDDDAVIVNFSAINPPAVVGPDVSPITDSTQCYAGAYYIAFVKAFGYVHTGTRGASFGLEGVQKVRDGGPISMGRIPANKMFKPIEGSGGAAEIFS